MKKILFLFFISQFYWLTSFSQSFYVGNIDYFENGPIGNLYRVTITPNGIVSKLINNCAGSYFFSIAMNKNTLYWLDGTNLYKGDIVGDDLINCQPITPIPGFNSLTNGSDGSLYYVGFEQLSKINPATGVVTALGAPNYYPSGDLTFYNNALYMASGDGIVKLNNQDPGKSTVVIDTKSYGSLYGLVSVATNLHKNTVYGLIYVSGTQTDILELDIDNNKVVGIVGSLPYFVLDGASSSENGSISGIKIDHVKVQQDCSTPTKGIVEVITAQHDEPFIYTLSTCQSNNTGVFNNLPAGDYNVTIKSANDQQTVDIKVPSYKLTKPVYTYQIKNQGCEQDGEITFTTKDNLFSVKLGTEVFPLSHTFKSLSSAQNYHLEILNESGCVADMLDVNIPKDKCTIQFDKTVLAKECSSASDGNLQVLTKSHSLAYTFKLNELSNTTGIFNHIAPGSYTLKITSAEDELIMPVFVPDFKQQHPEVSYVFTNPACSTKGTIKFNIKDDTNLYRIKLGDGNFPIDHLFTELDKGIHHFIVTQNDCLIDEYDVELQYQPCPIIITQIVNRPECEVFSKGFVQIFTDPIPETLTYQLKGTINQTGIFAMLDPGTYQLTVSASGGGTPQTKTIVVADYKLTHPAINYVALNPACKDKGTVKFIIDDDVNLYRVKFGTDIYSIDHLFINLAAGPYHFTIITAKGCLVDEYDINLQYQPCPIVINNIDLSAECNVLGKGMIKVNVEPIPEEITYKLDNTTNTTGLFNMILPGTYQLIVTASGGGTPQNRSITVPDYTLDAPLWSLKQVNPVCEIPGTVQIMLTADNDKYNIEYNSSIFPARTVFTNLYAGTYHFKVLKKNNCIADEMDITMVQETCSPVTFPTAFTPNDDGANDIFRADPKSKATNYRMQVFDRWGSPMFLSTALTAGWDGNYNGKHAPVGVYYWIANYTTQENKPALQRGSVTLLR